jgi:hypothetical protein
VLLKEARLQAYRSSFLEFLVSFHRTEHPRVLVDFYTEVKYGRTKYYAASGAYSTRLGIPADLESLIKSVKLGPDIKKCTFFDYIACTKVK